MPNQKPFPKLYAVLSVDAQGREGLCAVNTPIGPQVAVTADQKLLNMYVEAIKIGQRQAEVPPGMKIIIAEYDRIDRDIVVGT